MSTGAATKRAKIEIPEHSIPVSDIKPDQALEQTQDLHGRIEQRAYQLYEHRGGEPGNEMADWLQAEQEIMGERMDSDLG